MLLSPAAPAAVDFARDVQPLFEKHCYECHGPKKQKNGFRLDRRSRAMAGVVRTNIIPGNSQSSRLYRRIVDGSAGTQMPLEDTLSEEQIETVRQWIDEGAHWPDELANEVDMPPPDASALALIERLRASGKDAASRRAVLDSVARDPGAINARGPDGATPLMYAALYGDAGILGAMLRAGGDPNIANDSGATALMWAVEDIAKVKLLLDAGADANAVSGFERTPLALATLSPDTTTAQLLLARGAKPTPLALAGATRGDENLVRAMVAAGAKDKGEAAVLALRTGCFACIDALQAQRATVPRGLSSVVPPAGPGDPQRVRAALERDADVKIQDLKGRTTLMSLAISADVTPDLVQSLIDRGADVHARSPREGLNALDYALRLGRQPIIDVFTRAGLQPTAAPRPQVQFVVHNSVRAAVDRSLPLLQQSSQTFYARSGCVACHHNLQTAITVTEARRAGF
jgi:ankyrin repeat protein